MLHRLLIGVSLGQALKGEDKNNEHYADEVCQVEPSLTNTALISVQMRQPYAYPYISKGWGHLEFSLWSAMPILLKWRGKAHPLQQSDAATKTLCMPYDPMKCPYLPYLFRDLVCYPMILMIVQQWSCQYGTWTTTFLSKYVYRRRPLSSQAASTHVAAGALKKASCRNES